MLLDIGILIVSPLSELSVKHPLLLHLLHLVLNQTDQLFDLCPKFVVDGDVVVNADVRGVWL